MSFDLISVEGIDFDKSIILRSSQVNGWSKDVVLCVPAGQNQKLRDITFLQAS